MSLAESIKIMQDRKRDPSYLEEKVAPIVMTASERAYRDLITSLKSVNYKKERMLAKHDLE